MSFIRRIAAGILMVVLGVAAPGSASALFHCRVDGTVSNGCCCPHRTDAAAPPALASACCCEVHRLDIARPAAPADTGHRDALALSMVASLAEQAPCPSAVKVQTAEIDPIGRAGPSLLLLKHSRLI
jgi:hypothetical protein